MLCLPNPDSPTGTVFDPESLKEIIITAEKAGTVVLIDEAYYPFYDKSCINEVDSHANLVVARTFAKAWGLAGLRIGFGAANRELAGLLHKVRPMYEVNTIAVHMMEKMLDDPDIVAASVSRLNAGKRLFLAEIESFGLRTWHANGNFCHVAFDNYAEKVHEALKGMVLYRQDFSEPCLKGFSRFSSTTEQLIKPVIDKITSIIR